MELDYESFTDIVLSVIVTDDDPNHVSNCLLNITITDVNDNEPVFVSPERFTVSEDAEIKHVIGTVNVRKTILLYNMIIDHRLIGY